jgi:ABC-2 type transport system ATP-binding protein
VLELRDLARRYGDVVALDGISFSVPPGQMFGFVGPNGAGKTTAMRIVLGVLAPDRGEVVWQGRKVDFAVRSRFGYMPEERGLYPKMRVRDQLVYLARLHGLADAEARRAAERWIERLGLSERAGDRVEELSLGNQQRVQLAAALVHDPDLLVLDEPFSGLDPVGVDVLSGVLADYAATGVPVVFSSHQLELVERLCEAVAIVKDGRLVASGSVEELREDGARGRRIRVEVADAGEDWVAGVPGADVLSRDARGVLLALHDGAGPDAVLDAARAAGTVTHFSLERPTLTELFREAVASEAVTSAEAKPVASRRRDRREAV